LWLPQEVLEGTNGDMITQLSNGCLCCTVRDDLIQALNRLVGHDQPLGMIYLDKDCCSLGGYGDMTRGYSHS